MEAKLIRMQFRAAIGHEASIPCRPRGSRGGRGLNSPKGNRPATASTLMQRFFSGAKTLNYFSGIKKSNVDRRQFLLANQRELIVEPFVFEHLFSARRAGANCGAKIVAEFPGGGLHDGF